MILRRYIHTATIACSLTFGLTGSAFAAEDVSLSETGPGSVQAVEIDTTLKVTQSNTNIVQVTNENVQEATSGDVSATKNTTVGGELGSGDAANINAVGTSVAVSNASISALPVGGNGNNSGNVGAVGGSGGASPVAGGGKVQGAAVGGFGGGVAMLPEVGASVTVDVSALRAAWQPQSSAPATAVATASGMFTGLMLLTATLLSVIGALGSAWYARKREERV